MDGSRDTSGRRKAAGRESGRRRGSVGRISMTLSAAGKEDLAEREYAWDGNIQRPVDDGLTAKTLSLALPLCRAKRGELARPKCPSD
jgi:hypothetical protein